MTKAVDYIEEHITEKIDNEKSEEITDCPGYHFQKMFFYMTNISLTSYPPIRFSLSVHGMEELNYRIENKKVFRKGNEYFTSESGTPCYY